MISLNLRPEEERAYHRALFSSHRIRVRVELADHNEHVIESLTSPTSYVLDGSIQYDMTGEPTRSLSLTLLDPKRKLGFIPDSPAQGSLFADRFVSVHYGVWVDELDDWIDVPVFFGPLTAFQHAGPIITLEAQGKEALLLAPHYAVQGYTIQKWTRLDDAIKRVGRKAGESKYSIPNLRTRLRRARTIRPQAEPWRAIKGGETDANGKRVAGLVELGEIERHVYYDGRGRLTVRRAHRNPAITLRLNRMTEQPQVSYDNLEFRNHVRVIGDRAKGSKHQVSGHATLANKHPLSPHKLGRLVGDRIQPRYLAEFVEASLKTDEECERRAESVLDRKAKTGIEVSVSCLPIPHLEEGDIVRVVTDDYHIEAPAREFTLPLTAGEAMTIGETRRVRPRGNRRHRHHHPHPGTGGQAGPPGRVITGHR